MKDADKEFKAWYEKESGKEITDGEYVEMKGNLLEFYHILDRWARNRTPQRDLNPELFESQLVDE